MALTEAQKRQAERNRKYWADREAEQLKHYVKDEAEYDKEIKRIYTETLDNVQKEIDGFYGKYAAKEGITLAEAKKRVSQLDIAAYERKAARYVKDKDFSPKANEEMRLYNATMKINRLELLKANIGLELISGTEELNKYMEGILQGRTEEELQRQAGILGKTIKNNAAKAHAIVNCSFHNATFSDRIWLYQDLLRNDLNGLLQSGLIQGKNPRLLARDIKKKFDTSTYNAERLMRTELARVQTEAQKQSFERNGFTEYEFIVNGGCCDICAALSGKHFKVDKMMPGENAPPMHPHCRCSTAAYEDSEDYNAWLNYLEKGGTTAEWNELTPKAKDTFKKLLTNNVKSGKVETGGKSLIDFEEWYNKRSKKAKRQYDKIRKANDIEAVAKSSGMSIKEIEAIKNHIFYNKHIKYDGEIELFEPDYDMAVAWKRLVEGNPEKRDILLLKHELLESELERKYNLTAAEAHERANKAYAWDIELLKELGESGEADDLL